MTSEADIHFELYQHLKNSIEEGFETETVDFGEVRVEKNVNGGRVDVVVHDRRDRPARH